MHICVAWGVVVTWKLQIYLIFFLTVQLSQKFHLGAVREKFRKVFNCMKRYIKPTTFKYIWLYFLKQTSRKFLEVAAWPVGVTASVLTNTVTGNKTETITSVPSSKDQPIHFQKNHVSNICAISQNRHASIQMQLCLSLYLSQTCTSGKEMEHRDKFVLQICSMQMNLGRYCGNTAGWKEGWTCLRHRWHIHGRQSRRSQRKVIITARSKKCLKSLSQYLHSYLLRKAAKQAFCHTLYLQLALFWGLHVNHF